MDRSGNISASSYLAGVSVKISKKCRPPRRLTLPPGLCRFEPASHLFCENMDLIDEIVALKLVSSIRDLRAEETLKRRLKISFLENQIQKEKEIEEMVADISLSNIPHQGVTSLNGQILKHTQSVMEVLTPIWSSKIEKKEITPPLNLAEFESYSTNPFEEMELKTLDDKKELAILLQPQTPFSNGMQYRI